MRFKTFFKMTLEIFIFDGLRIRKYPVSDIAAVNQLHKVRIKLRVIKYLLCYFSDGCRFCAT